MIVDSADVGGSAVFDYAKFCCDVILKASNIGNQLSLHGAQVGGHLNMNSIAVSESVLFGTDANFHRVSLRGGSIGNQLSSAGAHFRGKFDMNSISVDGDIIMHKQTHFFSQVDLVGAKVAGSLSILDTELGGNLMLDTATIGNSLFLQRSKFHGPVDSQFVEVGSNLDLRATELTSIDLTSARIAGDLRLGSADVPEIRWHTLKDAHGNVVFPEIRLFNTTVGVLQDTRNSWPKELRREFQGFMYGALGGFGAVAEDATHIRKSDWFIDWLSRDTSFSPQPYRHLAELLANAGHGGMATDLLFASRVEERKELNPKDIKWWTLWGPSGYGGIRVWELEFLGAGVGDAFCCYWNGGIVQV